MDIKFIQDIYSLWNENKLEYEGYQLTFKKVDDLQVVTGKMIVSDPIVFEPRPFQRMIDPGLYPVYFCSAYDLEWKSNWETMAIVKVQERNPVRWEMAIGEGMDLENLKKEGLCFGYSVDSGMGCFIDEIVGKKIEELGEWIYDHIEEIESLQWDGQEGNMVYFCTGGDGFFSSYWGLDEQDKPVCLVTYFGGIMTQEEKRKIPVRPLQITL